jgi:tetratricopeptide (TPR) repeat protein
VFAVQADIAMNIANALSVVFRPGERELLARPPTVSTEAYVLYLKALEAEGDYAKTIDLLEQSVAADAGYAAPQGTLAFLWASELINTNYSAAVSSESRAEHETKVRDYAGRALALDPSAPLARSALGSVEMLNWRWNAAYERLRQARELAPNDVTQYDIFLLSYLGRYEEALAVVDRAIELYPNDPAFNALWQGWALGYAGRYDEAAGAFAAAVDEEVPGSEMLLAHDWLTRMEIARGNEAAALAQLRLAEVTSGTLRPPVFLPIWAYCYGRLGRADDAQRIFAEMGDREAAGASFGAGGWAMANLAIGDQRRALEWLEAAAAKAANHEVDEGFFNLMALRSNTTNDDVLRQPEFAALLERIEGD